MVTGEDWITRPFKRLLLIYREQDNLKFNVRSLFSTIEEDTI